MPFIFTKALLESTPMVRQRFWKTGALPGFRPVYMAKDRPIG